MGERSKYEPGTFSWADLATSDQPGAKAFYGALLGWEAEDLPVGEGAVYSMMRLGGKDVAAISFQPSQQREAGVPPQWQSYVTVESADAVADRAGELGGTVHAAAFDVMEAGRMAVIQDPQGAYFMVWQPHQHIGAALVNAPGALAWNELNTSDMDGAKSFYGDLFGWSMAPFESSPEPYLSIKNGEANAGGIRQLNPGTGPPNWLVYFAVEELDGALAKVAELGGEKMAGPIDIGMAKIAVVKDPQGAVFALYAGELEP